MTDTTSHASQQEITWLRNATLGDGRVVDVALNPRTGTIADVVTVDRSADYARGGSTGTTDTDLTGYLLVPAPAEPHAHLDKALTSETVPNRRGDLMGAIEAWIEFIPHITMAGMIERARRAALELVASGVTAVRSHANVHDGIGTDAVEALLTVRNELTPVLDLQVVALVGGPLGGVEGADNRAMLRDALRMDPSIIAGGCPHIDIDPFGASDASLAAAAEFGRAIDLHTDETLDPAHLEVRYLAERVRLTEFPYQAAASHCVSLGVQPLEVQRTVAEEVAAANVAVITLPQTNLFLQGRAHPVSPPRGLTALRPLLDAGVVVGAGADNVRDPFNSMGRSDPLETAALLVMAGHLSADEAFHAVTDGARAAMGLPVVRVEPGSPAELVALLGASIEDAIARADQQRMVWHRGRLVSSTTVTRRFDLS
jgi:cytosine/creatinine deaminase